MKKFVAMFAMVAFMAAVSVSAYGMNDEKPKKAAATEQKSEKKEGCSSSCKGEKSTSCGEKDKK